MRVATEHLPTNMTKMFLNVVINEHVAKEKFFKVCAFMTINNEKKLLCCESYIYKLGFDPINC